MAQRQGYNFGYQVPEQADGQAEKVETNRNYLQLHLPRLHLPVLEQDEADQEPGHGPAQVSHVPRVGPHPATDNTVQYGELDSYTTCSSCTLRSLRRTA